VNYVLGTLISLSVAFCIFVAFFFLVGYVQLCRQAYRYRWRVRRVTTETIIRNGLYWEVWHPAYMVSHFFQRRSQAEQARDNLNVIRPGVNQARHWWWPYG
jgi:hypothetical protein